jgi:uncharacterized protein
VRDDASLKKAASFLPANGNWVTGIMTPISFVAGRNRNFILEPLMGLRDEFYTVYFNVAAQEEKTKLAVY